MPNQEPSGLLRVRHRGWESAATPTSVVPAAEQHSGLSITDRCVLRHGTPWLPVSGEMHYSRVPRERWRESLQLMRAGGISVVASYVLWIHHEPERGRADFTGRNDLAAFVALCADEGLAVMLRIGPWCHAEARNGGLPDWVQHAPVRIRSNDEAYLALVREWYARLAAELGSLVGPDGPVIGIQIENELYDDPAHLSTLKQMARECGLTAPLMTATAWGGAQLPAGEFLPLYSGYVDGFWVDAEDEWDDNFRVNLFFSEQWDDPGVGADVRGTLVEPVPRDTSFPAATCELGGGMATTYHRRVVPHALDIAAVGNAKLGSGSAWQGYYMYVGGTNPAAHLQESHATDYPNDLPHFDYDFHAALGAAGQVSRTHAELRKQHAFIEAFGADVVAMPASFPDVVPSSRRDTSTLRWALRSDGVSGVVFVNWHQPHEPLPPRPGTVLEVELAERAVRFGAFTVHPGTVARMPVAWPIGPIELTWATASLLTSLSPTTLVLVAEPGTDVRFGVAESVDVAGAESLGAGQWWVDGEVGGAVRLTSEAGTAEVIIVGWRDAHRVWVLPGADGARRLLLSDAPLWTEDGRLVARSAESPRVREWRDGWQPVSLEATREGSTPRLVDAVAVRDALGVPASFGSFRSRASAPSMDECAELAMVVELKGVDPSPGARRVLRIDWAGDVAQLLVDGTVVADRFWDGTPWWVDLDALGGSGQIQLRILPLHPEAVVWLPAEAADRRRASTGPLASLDAVAVEQWGAWSERD